MKELIEIRRSFWRDAAFGGGIVGLWVIIMLYISSSGVSKSTETILSLVELVGMVFLLYVLLKKRSEKYGRFGFTFGQSISYVLAMMLFTGFVFGIGFYFLANYISEEVFNKVLESGMKRASNMYTAQEYERILSRVLKGPAPWLFIGILMMALYGGLISLFVSPFVKRAPSSEKTEEENE